MSASIEKLAQIVNQTEINLSNQNCCPECRSTKIIHDPESGETVCSSCGLVVDESVLDSNFERRCYSQQEINQRSRSGDPATATVHDRGLCTTISIVGRDRYGKKLPAETASTMVRLRKWQIRSRVNGAEERNLVQALQQITLYCDRLCLPGTTHQQAAKIYRKTLQKKLARGRTIQGLAAASVYQAIRDTGVTRTIKEVTEATGLDRRTLTRCYRLILTDVERTLPVPVSKPTQYVTRAATVLNISGELQSQALKLIGKLSRFCIAGKDPRSVAAAALYIVCAANKALVPKWKYARGGLTQVKIARELGVTEVTIRNRYKEILSEMRKSNDPEVQRYLVLLEEA